MGKAHLLVLGLLPCLALAGFVPGQSDPVVLCLDPERSIVWQTVPTDRAEISLAWPHSAVRAVLTVSDGLKTLSTTEVTDVSLDSVSLPFPLPENVSEEQVLALRLEWYDSSGNVLSWATQTARVGLVCGGTTAKGLLGDSFGTCVRTAVVQVPEGTTTLSLDGVAQEFGVAPTWCAIRPAKAGRHVVSRGFDGGSESGWLNFAFPGLILLFR